MLPRLIADSAPPIGLIVVLVVLDATAVVTGVASGVAGADSPSVWSVVVFGTAVAVFGWCTAAPALDFVVSVASGLWASVDREPRERWVPEAAPAVAAESLLPAVCFVPPRAEAFSARLAASVW
jgi:hypothetical protein